ncbi:MAG: hypothetical protein WCT26_01425 [Candidatus Buchananbacteria bacterium]
MNLTEQEKSIIKTLAHFDILDYPLTLLEIARFNELGLAISNIAEAIKCEPLNKLIVQERGLYFLKERESIISSRLERYRISLLKLKRARLFARLFSYFPWIRAVAIYSSLSLKNSQTDSDIDLFFITAADRAWSARFFINTFLKLFRLRPTPGNSRDKICASYWIDENNLDLSTANLDADYFYTYGSASFLFLSDSAKVENDFWQANKWINNILPAWQPALTNHQDYSGGITYKFQTLIEKILGLIPESSYKKLQMKILPLRYYNNNDGKKVSLGAGYIKLHDNDKRGKYNQLFEKNFNRILNT